MEKNLKKLQLFYKEEPPTLKRELGEKFYAAITADFSCPSWKTFIFLTLPRM